MMGVRRHFPACPMTATPAPDALRHDPADGLLAGACHALDRRFSARGLILLGLALNFAFWAACFAALGLI